MSKSDSTFEQAVGGFQERCAALEAENSALRARISALDALFVCYRVGKRPSEALFARLRTTEEAVKALDSAHHTHPEEPR